MRSKILNARNLSKVMRLPPLIVITVLIVFSGCTDDDTMPSINEDFMNEMEAARMKMMEDMNAAPMTMDPDVDFANMMIPHHQGSVDMVNILLKYGKHEEVLEIGRGILEADQASIDRLEEFLEAHGEPVPQEGTGFMNEMEMMMMKMDEIRPKQIRKRGGCAREEREWLTAAGFQSLWHCWVRSKLSCMSLNMFSNW